jgi:alkyl hydroperoxide reductase subunit AhpC
MVELGQLEKRHEDFSKRGLRVVVVSNDDQPTSQKTQADFPHLVVIADTDQKLAKALQVLDPGTGANAPTTFLVDRSGTVRWLFRSESFLERLSPDELLEAIAKDAKL